MMERHPEKARLIDGIRVLGLDLSEQVCVALIDYAKMLERWNRVYNLTAIRDSDKVISHHLLDSLAALPWVDRAVGSMDAPSILDVGSGGGLPGIPWGIARPAWVVTLIDSNQKKSAFLQQAVIELQLPRVEVCCRRVEQLETTRLFRVVTARAFSDLCSLIRVSRPYLASDGRWLALKGKLPQEEIDALPADIEVLNIVELSVPGVEGERHLVEMKIREEQ